MARIVIFTPRSNFIWGHDGSNLGGSELWAEALGLELSKEHEVVLVCSTGGKRFIRCGMLVCDHRFEDIYSTADVVISSRTAEGLSLKAGKKYMIYHDVVTQRNWEFFPNLQGMMYSGRADEVTGYVFVSEWQKDFVTKCFSGMSGFDPFEGRAHVIPNGFYPGRFENKLEKKRRLIFSSNPERGLQLLLELFPEIRRRTGAELRVCYGLDFYESHTKPHINESWLAYIKDMLNQEGVTYLGHLSQDELAKEYLEAKVWVYPSNFPETFCITALEAMAAGCNVVATNQAALPQTLDQADLIAGPAGTNEYNRLMIGLVEKALESSAPDYSDHLQKFTWKSVADDWKSLMGL